MNNSKTKKNIKVSHLEFKLSNILQDPDGQVGCVSFFLNGFIQFRNIPIKQNSAGEIHVELTAAENIPDGILTTCILRDDVRQEIERQVTEQLLEVVP